MKCIVLAALLLSGCMVDRTGQSVTSRIARESAIQTSRVHDAEKLAERTSERVKELEEVMAYRGEQEELELENLEGIQMEIRRLRNDVEKLQRAALENDSATTVFRADADSRITATAERLESLERIFGVEGSTLPLDTAKEADQSTDSEKEKGGKPPEKVVSKSETSLKEKSKTKNESAKTKEVSKKLGDVLVLVEQNLTDGHPRVARALLEKARREIDGAGEDPEVLYRYAETWFMEGLYEQARANYAKIIGNSDKSSWAAWATVRIGECSQHLGETEEAHFFWNDVLARYPDSEAAKLAKSLINQ